MNPITGVTAEVRRTSGILVEILNDKNAGGAAAPTQQLAHALQDPCLDP